MDTLVEPQCYEQAFEMLCVFFTVVAVFASYLLTLRG